MNSTSAKPRKGFAPIIGHVLRLIVATLSTVAAVLHPLFDHNQVRTFVRLMSVGCVRTSACIAASSVVGTETGPTSAFVLSATRLRLCPNTWRSWVPVVTQENCTCQTATGRAANGGSSNPTYPNDPSASHSPASPSGPSNQGSLPGSQPGIDGTPALPVHSPNPQPRHRLADSTGRRSGGRLTTARTVAVALTRSLVRTGGF